MRWLKFNTVGVMGAALQFTLLALFTHVAGMHYLLATAFSVEAAILHNFVWHRRWTWHDRRGISYPAIVALARFNLTNGLVSLTANLLSAYLLTGVWRVDPVIASLVSTGVASLANFFLSDRFVFASLLGPTTRRDPGIRSTNQASTKGGCLSNRGPQSMKRTDSALPSLVVAHTCPLRAAEGHAPPHFIVSTKPLTPTPLPLFPLPRREGRGEGVIG